MKSLLIPSVICALSLSFNASAALKDAKNLKFVGDTTYASLCEAAATDNLRSFKSSVRRHASNLAMSKKGMLSALANADKFSCAGQSVAEFSEARGAQNVTNYLLGNDTQVASTDGKFKFVGDTGYKNFCKAALTDDVETFKSAVSAKVGRVASSKQGVLKKVLAGDNVTCGGQNLTEFFQQRDAKSVMQYISDKVTK